MMDELPAMLRRALTGMHMNAGELEDARYRGTKK